MGENAGQTVIVHTGPCNARMVLTETIKFPGSNVISTASTDEPMELASITGADDTFLDE